VAQGEDPEFKPQYLNKTKQNKTKQNKTSFTVQGLSAEDCSDHDDLLILGKLSALGRKLFPLPPLVRTCSCLLCVASR
jgi:hypothetical protein